MRVFETRSTGGFSRRRRRKSRTHFREIERVGQGEPEVLSAGLSRASPSSATGGSVKAEGLGDGPLHGKVAIAKLRLTLPPATSDRFAFILASQVPCLRFRKYVLPTESNMSTPA